MIVYFEASDPDRVAKRWAESTDPFDLWLRAQIDDIHGLDPWEALEGTETFPGHSWTTPQKATPLEQ